MMQCGLLGRKLSHSYSPQIHNYLGNYDYKLYEIEPDNLKNFLASTDFTGLNVTIPYKKDVISYCDKLSERAQKLGAVNTIVRQDDGCLIGHNTDYFGFQSMLKRSGLSVTDKKVLVLGSGGASATAVAVLTEANANVVVISRNSENNYTNIAKHSDAAVIVNATPVGMYPDVDHSPIDLSLFPKLEGVLDLIYNPSRTKLLMQAEQLGLVTENGLWMLVAQAKESAEWFTGNSIEDKYIAQIYNILQKQMENIILIGMPGCGKSTVGQLLANKLGRIFIDADSEVVNTTGMSIPMLFDQFGESGFRQKETEVLANLGKRSGLVIATGGGCVTRFENYSHLHRNGTIIWIKRDIDQLPTDGRPLSQTGKLQQMYEIRRPMYENFSDLAVDNYLDPEITADTIIEALKWEE